MKTVALSKALAAFGCFWLAIGPAVAQNAYPAKPIEIVVPFAPGGSIDITFRLIAPSLTKRLGQQVVIVNKAGGGATIGMYAVAQAAPDGYTFGAASFAFAANPFVVENIPFDTVKDLAPVTMVARSPVLLIVNPKTPVNTTQEFIDWVKSRPPGELNYGSVGVASSGHLITELFLSRAGLKMTHVPYNAGPLPALAQGEIHLQIGPIPSASPWLQDGRLRAVAVTSLEPFPLMPGLPTVSKTLPGFEAYEWPSLVAPAKTPRAIIDRIQREVALTVAEPEVSKRLAELGSVPVAGTPEELGAYIKSEMATWEKVANQLHLREKK